MEPRGLAIVASCCWCFHARAARGDDAPAPADTLAPHVSGFVDGTYNYNFNQPAGGETPYYPYVARHHSFLLDAAHLAVTGNDDRLAYAVELDAGSDAQVNSGGNLVDVQEAWLTYRDHAGFGLKAGKFVTTEGIEVIEAVFDPTISRGFLFWLAEPGSMVGALATYQIDDQLDVALGVVNGWDVLVDNNAAKTIVGKFGITTDTFLLTLSTLAGPERAGNNDDWRVNFDVTGMYRLGTTDVWFQGHAATEQGAAPDGDSATWFGIGLQPVVHVTSEFAVGTRVELFDDHDGARTGIPQLLVNLSAAPAYSPSEHLTLRAELRADVSAGRDAGVDGPYVNHDGAAKALQVVGLTEAVMTF
ncbi:MAG: outer membrane beta-barrel protein [Kofleriaceae bacterium]|nr:outer membrane beta-barrel protein [Kofleriaceae bacterium]MCB9571778.1 outer membrane beta-barrel protein [Kofleriaceae bacterium]